MCTIEADSFYINKFSQLIKSDEGSFTYAVLPEYGRGYFTIFNIVPGFKLAHNKFCICNKIVNRIDQYRYFSKPILKINYCIKGKMLAYNTFGRVCISDKGSTAYYTGIENIDTVEHFDQNYESITMFGYIDQVVNIFSEVFGIKKLLFQNFFNQINHSNDFIVIKSNAQVLRLVNEILDAVKTKNIDKIKLKSIELLLHELKNIEQNKAKKEFYYSRSTLDKIIRVEKYVSSNVDKKITIKELCVDFDISLDTLKRCFKQMYSNSIYAYIKNKRMEKGKQLLEQSDKSITEIALMCGYSNHHSFGKAFKQQYKIPPKDMRKIY